MPSHGELRLYRVLFMPRKLIPHNLKPFCTAIYLIPLISDLCSATGLWQVECPVSVKKLKLTHRSFLGFLDLAILLILLVQLFKTSDKVIYFPSMPFFI